MHRRRFLSAAAAGSVSLLAPNAITAANAASARRVFRSSEAVAQAARLAPRALAALDRHAAAIPNTDVVGIVDFAEPSAERRFHLLEVASGLLIASELVAHGKGSDPENTGWLERFSNEPGSYASCRGSFVTGELYEGEHGLSRRLIGLDQQNSLALSRGIVIHAAAYVDPRVARSAERVGRSQGCFAVSRQALNTIVNCLGPGRLLFAWK